MSAVFKFKQFEIDQNGCAMKINTDGVLLAALATHHQPNFILDIGTGTGVIALMLAQRYAQSQITAIEIDYSASEAARKNFQKSIFNQQLNALCVSIEKYESTEKFDLIVSNPPFFVNDFKSLEHKKELARHTTDIFFSQLITKVASLLSEEGVFWFILPIKQSDFLIEKANQLNLFVQHQINLHSDINKKEFRKIVCLGKTKTDFQLDKFYIYEKTNTYTQAYKNLLKPFFLNY